MAPGLEGKITETINSFNNFEIHFQMYRKIFSVLMKFDLDQVDPESAKSRAPLLDAFRYGWLLYIAMGVSSDICGSYAEMKFLCVLIISFIAVNVDDAFQRTVAEASSASNQLLNLPIPTDYFNTQKLTLTWRADMEKWLNLLSSWAGLDLTAARLFIERFKQFLHNFQLDGMLKNEGQGHCKYQFIIPQYFSALDGGPNGLLQANLQSLVHKYDKTKHNLEFDLLNFCPTWDRAVATPLLFKRTPMRSVASKNSVRNLFGGSSGSGLGKKMAATPLTLNGANMQPKLQNLSCLVESFEMLLDFQDFATNKIHETIPEEMRERVKAAVGITYTNLSYLVRSYWSCFSLPLGNSTKDFLHNHKEATQFGMSLLYV